MTDDALATVTLVLLAVGGVIVLLAGVAAVFWLSDGTIEATVVDKECPFVGDSTVTVRTKLLGIEHTVSGIDRATCNILEAGPDGNFVQYHVRSGRTILYESEGGACIWDTAAGPGGGPC